MEQQCTPYLVIDGKGSASFLGETYIKSFVSVIPDLFHNLTNINNSAIFGRMIQTNHAIGGSFVGELIYNFGSLYWLFSLLFGMLYSWLSSKIYIATKVYDYRTICLFYPITSSFLWWVRDSVGSVTRSVIWLLLIYWIIHNLCLRKHMNYGNIINSRGENE